MSDQLSGLTRGRSRSLRSPRRSLDSCFARRFTSTFLLIHEVADCVGSLGGRGLLPSLPRGLAGRLALPHRTASPGSWMRPPSRWNLDLFFLTRGPDHEIPHAVGSAE